MFRFLNIAEAAAGAYHTDHKKQHQKRKTNRLHSAVDIDNDRPYPAAFEILRCSRNELPYLSEFFIPSFEGVLEILNYPVITQFRSTSLKRKMGRP